MVKKKGSILEPDDTPVKDWVESLPTSLQHNE